MYAILSRVKYFLWKLGLWPNKCPYCGLPLMVHGFPPNERWTCQEGSDLRECRFNENA